jgi:hypothetical protein
LRNGDFRGGHLYDREASDQSVWRRLNFPGFD